MGGAFYERQRSHENSQSRALERNVGRVQAEIEPSITSTLANLSITLKVHVVTAHSSGTLLNLTAERELRFKVLLKFKSTLFDVSCGQGQPRLSSAVCLCLFASEAELHTVMMMIGVISHSGQCKLKTRVYVVKLRLRLCRII